MNTSDSTDKPKRLSWICTRDHWAHDIQDTPGGQMCIKCREFLDNLAISFANEVAAMKQAALLRELLEQKQNHQCDYDADSDTAFDLDYVYAPVIQAKLTEIEGK